MKLYATITSERASKSQGGNKRLDISIIVGSESEQHEAGVVSVREKDKGVFVVLYHADWNREGMNLATIDTTKGKRQKGEIVLDTCYCGSNQVHTHE